MVKRCCFKGCKVKLKLTDMECRCEKRFCFAHRLPETHNCCYDYKKDKVKVTGVSKIKITAI